MNKTGLVWHELYMWHDTGNYAGLMQPSLVVQPNIHYESPEPKRRIKNLLDVTGVTEQLTAELLHTRRQKLRRFAFAGAGLVLMCAVLLTVEVVQRAQVG